MGTLKISYPVDEEARRAMARYPAITRAFKMPDSGRSEYEIVRLLSNTHYNATKQFLEFFDRWLDFSGTIGRKVLKALHPFELEQMEAELFLFVHLYSRLGDSVRAKESKGDSVCQDIEVRTDDCLIKIEIYTPVDFMGFQLFKDYIRMVLRYLDVPIGYHFKVEVLPVQETSDYDQNSLFYPYTIPNDEYQVHAWLNDFSEQVANWLSDPEPNPEFSMTGPGGKIVVNIKLAEFSADQGDRMITLHGATRSTDTKLFFDMGTAEDTARSQWGLKIKGKLWRQQCGMPAEGVLRMLVVNFSMAETGWPHFISEDWFSKRFGDMTRILAKDDQPYDVVLPAQLAINCCFGKPAWIDKSWCARGSQFIRKGELDKQCVPPTHSIAEQVAALLEE
jgi:hypothetical protein